MEIVKLLIYHYWMPEYIRFNERKFYAYKALYTSKGTIMKRIAHLFFLFDVGGVEKNIANLSSRLSEEGYNVKILISHRIGMMASQLHPDVELILLPQREKMASLIKLLHGIDICHIHSINENPFFAWACNMANVPAILNSIESSVQYPYTAYCDFVICPSTFLKYKQSRIQHIQVIPNGVAFQKTSSKIRKPGGKSFWQKCADRKKKYFLV